MFFEYTLFYMNVLIYLAGATIGPSVGIHLDEAIKDLCAGNIPDDVFTYRHGW